MTGGAMRRGADQRNNASHAGTFFDNPVTRRLGSLRLAVVVMGVLVTVLAVAPLCESKWGSETVRRLCYHALWFDIILLVLGLNVLCAALLRFPWKRKHIGFLTTHAGILVLLVGAMVGRRFWAEGQLSLPVGAPAQHLAQAFYDVLRVEWPAEGAYREVPVDLDRQMAGRAAAPALRIPGVSGVVTLANYYPHSVESDDGADRVLPAPLPENAAERRPAVQVQWPGTGGDGPGFWLRWGEPRPLRLKGGEEVLVTYGAGNIPLAFSVMLEEFVVVANEGTETPASFTSHVLIRDLDTGTTVSRKATMNHPVTHRGYKISQSAFRRGLPGGAATVSILNVIHDAGWPLKIVGCAMIVTGVFTMFYLQPDAERELAGGGSL